MLSYLGRIIDSLRARAHGMPVTDYHAACGLVALYRRGRLYAMLGLETSSPATEVLKRKTELDRQFASHRRLRQCLNDCFSILNPPRSREAYKIAREQFDTALETVDGKAGRVESSLWGRYWEWLGGADFRHDPERMKARREEIRHWLQDRVGARR
jgi:hypothetical protein